MCADHQFESPNQTPSRLGEIGTGVAVLVDAAGGVAVVRGDESTGGAREPLGSPLVQWWVGAEDHWHRPATAPSIRQRRIDGLPIIETSMRVPSGDVVSTVGCARIGPERPSAIIEVHNGSPIPVALAFVVSLDGWTGTMAHVAVSPGGITIGGTYELRLGRPALGFASGPTADDVLQRLESGDISATPEPVAGARWLAMVLPLPHTATSLATFGPPTITAGDTVDPIGRESVPTTDRIASGWRAHLDRLPRVSWSHRVDAERFVAASCDVLIGAARSDSLSTIGRVAEAEARLGCAEDLSNLISLVAAQHRTGRIGTPDSVELTVDFVAAVGARWSAGWRADSAEDFVGPVVVASHWLSKKRRRPLLVNDSERCANAFDEVSAMLVCLGQPEAAEDLAEFATSIRSSVPQSVAVDAPQRSSGLSASCDIVDDVLGQVASVSDRRIDLLPTWVTGDSGVDIDVLRVPTRHGRLSFGIRWHGERPALLWELDPNPESMRQGVALSCSALDEQWSTTELSGETLLAAPAVSNYVPSPNKATVVTRLDADERREVIRDGDLTPPPDSGGSFT